MFNRLICIIGLLIYFQVNVFANEDEIAMRVQLPFPDGLMYVCTQNSDDYPTHNLTSTRYDLDFGMPEGSVVVAAATGTAYRGSGGGFGNYIKIDHNNGYFTLYAHLMDNGYIVENGQYVSAGQPIGFSGNTGSSTGPHLHFGVHKGSGIGESVRMEVKANEYKKQNNKFVFIKEDYFATGLENERECYCMYDKGKKNAGNYYESIPLDGIFNEFQCHELDNDEGILCWQGDDGHFAFCDDGRNHTLYFETETGFSSRSVSISSGSDVERYCYSANTNQVNLFSYLTGTGVGGGNDPGDEGTSKGPDVNVKKVEVSNAGKEKWQHSITLGPNQKFDIEAKITNKGDEKADNFTINYHRSDDKDFSKNDKELDDDKKVDLKPGKSITKNARKIKAPSEYGKYYIFVRLSKNKGDTNPENDFSRNDDKEEYAVIYVVQPNLYVSSITLDGRDSLLYFDPGATVDFRATFKNSGGSINKDVMAKYFFSNGFNDPRNMPELNAAGAFEIGSDKIDDGKLESGEDTTRGMLYTLPTVPGQYTITAFINPANAVKESSKDDNCRSIHLTVLDPNASSDLDIQKVTVNDANSFSAEQGQTFEVDVIIRNWSEDGASAEATLRLYQSDDQTLDTGDQELTSISIGRLLPTQAFEGAVSLTLNNPGTFYILAKVEDAKDINSANDIPQIGNPAEFLTVTVTKPNRIATTVSLAIPGTDTYYYDNGFSLSGGTNVKLKSDATNVSTQELPGDVPVWYYFFPRSYLDEITRENVLTLQRIGHDDHEAGNMEPGHTDGEGIEFTLPYDAGEYVVAIILDPEQQLAGDDPADNFRFLTFNITESNRLTMIEFTLENQTTGEKFTQNGGALHVGDQPKITIRSKINGATSLDQEVSLYYYFFPEGTITEITPENLLQLQRIGKDVHEPDEWTDDGEDGEANEDFSFTAPGNYVVVVFLNPIGEIAGDSLTDNIRYLTFTVE